MRSKFQNSLLGAYLWTLLVALVWPVSALEELLADEPVSIGVSDFSGEGSLLDAKSDLGWLVLAAATRPLLSSATPPGLSIRLDQAEAMTLDAERREWTFLVQNSPAFTNQQPVTERDVLYSLQRCQQLGSFPQISFRDNRSFTEAEGMRGTIIARFETAPASKEVNEQFLSQLTQCPILHEDSARALGTLLGSGTALTGSGEYQVQSVQSGKSVELLRVGRAGRGPEKIQIRSFRDGDHGLTALRLGTIDLMVSADETLLQKAQADETLRVSICGGRNLLFRRGLVVECSPTTGPKLEVGKLHYNFKNT
jgi:hypothetical protein